MEAKRQISELEEQAYEAAYNEQAEELKATRQALANRQACDDIRREEGRKRADRRRKSRYYTKLYKAVLKERGRDTSVNEGYLLFRLVPYVEEVTGYLKDRGFMMTQKDIISLVDPMLKERCVKEVIKSLVGKEYLLTEKRGKQAFYRANPRYFFDGKEENNPYKAG